MSYSKEERILDCVFELSIWNNNEKLIKFSANEDGTHEIETGNFSIEISLIQAEHIRDYFLHWCSEASKKEILKRLKGTKKMSEQKWMPKYPWRDSDITITRKMFEDWYDRKIKPLFENAIEVFQYQPGHIFCDWSPMIDEEFGGVKKYSQSGLVINIKPIEKNDETAESLLREMTSAGVTANEPNKLIPNSLIERAKVFLEKNK